MPISDIVNVSISTTSPGPTKAGFGTPLILSYSATWAERTRTYTSLAGVAADFATTTPEYLAAQAVFSQNPAPTKVVIGRCALKPTQQFKISIVTVKDSTDYKVKIGGVTFTFTSGVGTTNDLIATGLQAAITGVAGFTSALTGSVGQKAVTVTGNAPGNWTSFGGAAADGGIDRNLLAVIETEADPGVATDLAAILLENGKWYFPLTPFRSSAIIVAIAAWVEANSRMQVIDTCDSACATQAEGTIASDVMHAISAAGYARTAVFFKGNSREFGGAAIVGNRAPYDPGSETWKFAKPAGITPDNLTATEIVNLEAKHGNYYYSPTDGVSMTAQGTVGDGEFIDVIRLRDAIANDMGVRVLALLTNQLQGKVPFDDDGIGAVEAQMRASIKSFIATKGIAKSPAYTVTVPLAANVSAADKAARRLTGCSFTAPLAGAIHATTISGTLTLG